MASKDSLARVKQLKENSYELVDLYLKGNSVQKIAEMKGVARATILKILHDNGVETRKRSNADLVQNPDSQAIVSEMYQSGLSISEIADACGVCRATVKRLLLKEEIEFRSQREASKLALGRRYLTDDLRSKILDKFADKFSLKDIAKDLGIPTGGVREVVVDAGLVIKKGRTSIPEHLLDEMLERYRSGVDLATVAKSFGVKYNTLYVFFMRRGYLRKEAPLVVSRVKMEDLTMMYMSGTSISELAKLSGLNYQTMYQRFKRKGLVGKTYS